MLRERSAATAVLSILLTAPAVPAAVIDCGAAGRAKIFDRLLSAGTARIQYRSDDAPCITKGPGGDLADLSGTFQVLYIDTPGSAQGAFVMPAPWYINETDKAKYLNTAAPGGAGEARKVGIKTAKLAKFGSKGLGDGTDLDVSSPPGPSGVLAILTVDNAADGNTYRVCTRWATSAGSAIRYEVIDGGLGRKLFLDRGVVASCNVVPTTTSTSTTVTTTTSTSSTTTTSTSTTTTSSTSTTVFPPTGGVMRFTTGAAGGICGEARSGGAGGTILKALTCGGLNIGGGAATVPEGPTPSGADTFLNTACAAGTCTVTARTSAQTGSNNTCSNTGCAFGPFLSISNGGLSTCVRNTFASPASGTLDAVLGSFSGSFPLTSTVTVTGNGPNPCPNCAGGTPGVTNSGSCDSTSTTPGALCTPVNAGGDTHTCLPSGVGLAPFGVSLNPISTGTESKSGPTFCPGQDATAPGLNGCFGVGATCDYIEERGAPAGTLFPGPKAARLASVFCIPATGNGLIDGAADLPGPGATSLPGTFVLSP